MHGVREIQIRTRDMEDMANNGIAAHWLYKSNQDTANIPQMRAREWVKGLLEMQQTAGNSLEFIESVSVDLFPDEVYVFTPRGEIMELPKEPVPLISLMQFTLMSAIGASPAESITTVSLSEPLESGVSVEIVTHRQAGQRPQRVNFVVTARAVSDSTFPKQQQHEDSVALGQTINQLAALSPDDVIDNGVIKARIEEHYPDPTKETILTDLRQVISYTSYRRNIWPVGTSLKTTRGDGDQGTEGCVPVYAKCCCPLPGDPIEGSKPRPWFGCAPRELSKPRRFTRAARTPMPLRWDDQIEGTTRSSEN